MALTVRHACLSDRGLTHEGNEDRWLADPVQGLYLVADGMADERPAQLAVERLPRLLRSFLVDVPGLDDPRTTERVQAALTEVNAEVRELGGTGSTLVLALVRGPRALLAHLGDSRIYLFRQGRLARLTTDHSLVQEMVDHGALPPEEAEWHAALSSPTRFLGMGGEPVADFLPLDLAVGDRLLLCSDGLTGMLPDDRLAAILGAERSAAEACRRLVAVANAAGGQDNVTTLILDIVG
jgi:serine/threonine protein phosphatase PrpC